MAKHAYVVKVPKTDPKSYHPDRPLSSLIQNQLFHLSLAERHVEKRHRTGVDVYSIKTEGEAAEYIRHLTAKLHPAGAMRPAARKPTKGRAPRARTNRSKARRKN